MPIHFDTGFHHTGSFGDGEILDVLYRYLGLTDRLQKVPFNPDGFDLLRCLETGFEFRFPYGYERIRKRLLDTFPGETKAVNKYLQAVQEAFHSFPYLKLEPDQLDTSIQKSVSGPSLQEFLDGLTDNKALKWVLTIHWLLHGVPPEEAPFAFNACVVGSYYESVHGIEGGGLKLAQTYDTLLDELGVDVYLGQGASRIRVSSDNAVTGVRLEDGSELSCGGCISTVHPQDDRKRSQTVAQFSRHP